MTALKRSFYKGYVVMTALAQRAAYGGDSPLPGDGAAPLSLWLTEYGIQISHDIATQCVGEIIDDYSSVDGNLFLFRGAPLPKTGVDVDYSDSIPGLKSGASPC